MKKLSRTGLLLVFSCLLMGVLSSCGSDEPELLTVDYYIEVEESFLVNGNANFPDGYIDPVTTMRETIRKAYPKADNVGNDQAVVRACDEAYEKFYKDYTSGGDHLTCLMHLIKTRNEGIIVRESVRLKTYNIDVNPPLPPNNP